MEKQYNGGLADAISREDYFYGNVVVARKLSFYRGGENQGEGFVEIGLTDGSPGLKLYFWRDGSNVNRGVLGATRQRNQGRKRPEDKND